MQRDVVKKEIKEIAKQILKKDVDQTSFSSSLIFDLGADSLEIVELIMAIEKKFSIQFPDSIINKLNSLEDFVENSTQLIHSSSTK